MLQAIIDKHAPSLLIAIIVGLLSWFGKSVVIGNEDRAKLSAQVGEVATMVVELRQDSKTTLQQTSTLGSRLAEVERRLGTVESVVIYRNSLPVDPLATMPRLPPLPAPDPNTTETRR